MSQAVAQDGTELASRSPGRTFFGEPWGLAYLAFTEAWERFSYYGMTAILVLYMSQALLQPGRIDHVVGLQTLRSALAGVFGPATPLALASEIFGLYTGLIYFTPVLGGWVADRWIGRRSAVVAGALLMCAGHFAMAFDASFLAALTLLIVGCGLLKGNISTQVGALYSPEDADGRSRGFSIFSMAINTGAVGGPLLCGFLAQAYGWRAGFLLAGVLMLVGLATYLAGYRHLPAQVRRSRDAAGLRPGDGRIALVLIGVMALTIFQSVAYFETYDAAMIWIQRSVGLDIAGLHVPVAWFASIDPATSILFVPVLFGLWRWQAGRGRDPDEINKIAVGAAIAACANLVLAVACVFSRRISILVPIAYDVLLGIAFLYYWPTLLALISRTAPAQLKSTLMGGAFVSIFVADLIIGRLGASLDQMAPAVFWTLHAAVAATGALLAVLLAGPIRRALDTAQATA